MDCEQSHAPGEECMFQLKPFIWATSGFAVSLFAQPQAAEPPHVMTVCELLRQPSKYNGKAVMVRGVYFPTEHGLYLDGECDGVLVTKGHVWPSLILISPSREATAQRGLNYEHYTRTEYEIAAETWRAMNSKG